MSELLLLVPVLLFNVCIQVAAVLGIVRYLVKRTEEGTLGSGVLQQSFTLFSVTLVLLVGHLVQIGIWAWLFVAVEEFDNFQTAFYHSAVNFAALGYGDIVMSEETRLLGALEAANGVLMFGLSAATLYAVLIKLIAREQAASEPLPARKHK